MGIKVIPSKASDKSITLCCHGYGDSRRIVDVVAANNDIAGTLVGFNFPDYGIKPSSDHNKSTFGTVDEVLPLIYLLNHYVITLRLPSINLYGFSAGGGAIVNALAILNQHCYEQQLRGVGITPENQRVILDAVQQERVILDCPLKSVAEIIALRGKTPGFVIMAERFEKNHLNPIDSVQKLSGLKLTIILHFQNPDDILNNRDDALFIERLRVANGGKTHVIVSSDGGHNAYHKGLWAFYKKLK